MIFAQVLVIVNHVSVYASMKIKSEVRRWFCCGCFAYGDCHVIHNEKDQPFKTQDLSFGLMQQHWFLQKFYPLFQSVLTSELKAEAADFPAHINCSLGFSVAFLSNCHKCENGSGGANGCRFCFLLAGSRYESVVCFDMVRSFT